MRGRREAKGIFGANLGHPIHRRCRASECVKRSRLWKERQGGIECIKSRCGLGHQNMGRHAQLEECLQTGKEGVF